MNIIEAFNKYKKIRRKQWMFANVYLFTESILYDQNKDLDIYIHNADGLIVKYSLLAFEVMANDWEEYKEKNEVKEHKKVIDCLDINFCQKPHALAIKKQRESEGWVQIFYKEFKDNLCWLKMVKYED